MSVLYIVLPVALILAGAGVGAFIWSVQQGQLDDTVTPSVRLLNDEEV